MLPSFVVRDGEYGSKHEHVTFHFVCGYVWQSWRTKFEAIDIWLHRPYRIAFGDLWPPTKYNFLR